MRALRRINNDLLPAALNATACDPLLRSFLCQRCNPFAGHIWSPWPRVCSDFHDKFLSACGHAIVEKIGFKRDLYHRFYCSPFDTLKYYGKTLPTPILRPAFPVLAGLLPPHIIDAAPVPGAASLWWAVGKEGLIVEFDGASSTFADAAAAEGPVLKLDRAAIASVAVLTVVLDIRSRVFCNGGVGETGLLKLAFSPNFARDRRFYLNYVALSATSPTDPRPGIGNRISRFTFAAPDGWPATLLTAAVAPAVSTATAASEEILLTYDQPYQNHNGGWLGFGPADGYLYVATGDGGLALTFDPHNNAQNLTSHLGKILRIEVNPTPGSSLPYAIPASNPFEDSPVWAYGLRNPWRCSFDAESRLWCADVGFEIQEEISIIVRSGDYGWNWWEGAGPLMAGSRPAAATAPAYAYCHSANQAAKHGCDVTIKGASIIGGAIYRGLKYSRWLARSYIFADFESFTLAALKLDTTSEKWVPIKLFDSIGFMPVSFAEGPAPNYELFIVEYSVQDNPMIYEFRCGPLCGEPESF